MPKLTQKEIEKEAQRVEEEYAYMDKMSFKAWIWEFIRRSPRYQQFYEEFKKLLPMKKRSLAWLMKFADVLVEYKNIPLSTSKVTSHKRIGISETSDKTSIRYKDVMHFSLPDYQFPYDDFPLSEKHMVQINGLDPYKMLNADMHYFAKYDKTVFNRIGISIDYDKFFKYMRYLGIDTPESVKQNIWVRISKKATDRDLKKLLNEIKPYLAPEKKT